jgi:hypothetical protein
MNDSSSLEYDDPLTLDRRQILCGEALLTFDDVELDSCALGESLEPITLDRTVMTEDVFLAIVTRDEAVALLVVEPFHYTLDSHISTFSFVFYLVGAGRWTPSRSDLLALKTTRPGY